MGPGSDNPGPPIFCKFDYCEAVRRNRILVCPDQGVTIVAMIVLGLTIILFKFGDLGKTASFSNLWTQGGFFPFGALGVLLTLQMVMFAYQGLELIGVSAGETENPEKVLPHATGESGEKSCGGEADLRARDRGFRNSGLAHHRHHAATVRRHANDRRGFVYLFRYVSRFHRHAAAQVTREPSDPMRIALDCVPSTK